MNTWNFAQRVTDADPLLCWISDNLPKAAVVRTQVHGTPLPGLTDVRVVLSSREAALRLGAYMDGPEFTRLISKDMRYFRVSWYPLRPSFEEAVEPSAA